MPRDPSPKRLSKKRVPKNNPNQMAFDFGPEQLTLNLGYNMNAPQPATPASAEASQSKPTMTDPSPKPIQEELPFGKANPHAGNLPVLRGERSPSALSSTEVIPTGNTPAIPKDPGHTLYDVRDIYPNDEFTPQLDDPNKSQPGNYPAVPPTGGVPAVPTPAGTIDNRPPPPNQQKTPLDWQQLGKFATTGTRKAQKGYSQESGALLTAPGALQRGERMTQGIQMGYHPEWQGLGAMLGAEVPNSEYVQATTGHQSSIRDAVNPMNVPGGDKMGNSWSNTGTKQDDPNWRPRQGWQDPNQAAQQQTSNGAPGSTPSPNMATPALSRGAQPPSNRPPNPPATGGAPGGPPATPGGNPPAAPTNPLWHNIPGTPPTTANGGKLGSFIGNTRLGRYTSPKGPGGRSSSQTPGQIPGQGQNNQRPRGAFDTVNAPRNNADYSGLYSGPKATANPIGQVPSNMGVSQRPGRQTDLTHKSTTQGGNAWQNTHEASINPNYWDPHTLATNPTLRR